MARAWRRTLAGAVVVGAAAWAGAGWASAQNDGAAAAERLTLDRARVNRTLDALHENASRADGAAYFALFTPDAIFLGTDATERWTMPDFRRYADPVFAEGRGWTYTVTSRHVYLSEDGNTAWFDETLFNEKYGDCRGSGVLVRQGVDWRIAQYNLTVPIPNALLPRVAEMIREEAEGGLAPEKP